MVESFAAKRMMLVEEELGNGHVVRDVGERPAVTVDRRYVARCHLESIQTRSTSVPRKQRLIISTAAAEKRPGVAGSPVSAPFPERCTERAWATPKTDVEEQLEFAARSHTPSGFMYERYEHRRVRTTKTVSPSPTAPSCRWSRGFRQPPGVAPDICASRIMHAL